MTQTGLRCPKSDEELVLFSYCLSSCPEKCFPSSFLLAIKESMDRGGNLHEHGISGLTGCLRKTMLLFPSISKAFIILDGSANQEITDGIKDSGCGFEKPNELQEIFDEENLKIKVPEMLTRIREAVETKNMFIIKTTCINQEGKRTHKKQQKTLEGFGNK